MAVFLACLFSGGIHFRIELFSSFLVSDGKAWMPNVVDKEPNDAQDLLETRNLSSRISDKQLSREIPKDRLLSQTEDAGNIVNFTLMVWSTEGIRWKETGMSWQIRDVCAGCAV